MGFSEAAVQRDGGAGDGRPAAPPGGELGNGRPGDDDDGNEVDHAEDTALDSRVIIEQAKGRLAERLGADMNQAFSLLRDIARSRNLRLSDLAPAFVAGTETSSP